MTPPKTTETLGLNELRRLCAQETNNFQNRQQHDPQYCFEIFRRAVTQRDQQAWDAIYAQYHQQVLRWIRRNPMLPMLEEEEQYFVNRTFERMWGVLTPKKWAKFPDLKSVLRYLQMCANSVMVDYSRQKEQTTVQAAVDEAEAERMSGGDPPVESQVMTEEQRQGLWALVQAELKDEREVKVIYAKFVLGLKPAQIANHFSKLFADVNEVYRASENAMSRLRRSAALADFFGEG